MRAVFLGGLILAGLVVVGTIAFALSIYGMSPLFTIPVIYGLSLLWMLRCLYTSGRCCEMHRRSMIEPDMANRWNNRSQSPSA